MGLEITHLEFEDEDFSHFKEKLLQETKILKRWFDHASFQSRGHVCGLELEAWLVDQDFLPSPSNGEFLSALDNDLFTNELAQFNFELNAAPYPVEGRILKQFHDDLTKSWQACGRCAQEQKTNVLMIGSLPTLRADMLSMDYISPLRRYKALNQQIMNLRDKKSLQIDIHGKDALQMQLNDVMLESAATSLQIHLQVNVEEAVRFYNAAHIASAFMVAVGANSPYLFGKELWDETRIAVFEQAVSVASFRNKYGEAVGRVTFGTGYARKSLLEPFLENLEGYPVLLPAISEGDPDLLYNLRLHNGCIWRWNRPLIGTAEHTKPHLRIEHRVISSGPTIPDVVANIALFLGIVHFLSSMDQAPEDCIKFSKAKQNFYEAARYGLGAEIEWIDGKQYDIQSLILNTILPQAKKALLAEGVAEEDIHYYMDDIMYHRVLTGRNGAAWQKAYIATHGMDFQRMTACYFRNQERAIPVHEWEV